MSWSNILTSNGYGAFRLYLMEGYMYLLVSASVGTWNIKYNSGGTVVVSSNTWHHAALTRSGNTFRLFLDGTIIYTASLSSSLLSGGRNLLGAIYSNTYGYKDYFYEYMDEFRFSKVARWTSNFTVPTLPY